jgi:hypothetical protein
MISSHGIADQTLLVETPKKEEAWILVILSSFFRLQSIYHIPFVAACLPQRHALCLTIVASARSYMFVNAGLKIISIAAPQDCKNEAIMSQVFLNLMNLDCKAAQGCQSAKVSAPNRHLVEFLSFLRCAGHRLEM